MRLKSAFGLLRTLANQFTVCGMSEQMNRVYVLHHVRKDDEYGDDAKLIGVYRSQEAVDAAIARLAEQPGFRDYPEGFSTDAYELDKDHWSEGFVDLSDLH